MIVHFLITGYLFVQSLIGIDPVPYRLPYPFRLLLLLGTMAFHAFFGLAIMTGTGLLLADWYGAMGRTWGASAARRPAGRRRHRLERRRDPDRRPGDRRGHPVEPQRRAKETKRSDRNADRTGDAELTRTTRTSPASPSATAPAARRGGAASTPPWFASIPVVKRFKVQIKRSFGPAMDKNCTLDMVASVAGAPSSQREATSGGGAAGGAGACGPGADAGREGPQGPCSAAASAA